MTSYKCEFCVHQVGPIKPIPPECLECTYGNHFQIKTNLHPMDAAMWEKHQQLDRFIQEAITIPVFLWQRELLHQSLDKRPLYSRGCNRSTERAVVDVFLTIFDEYEKRSKGEKKWKHGRKYLNETSLKHSSRR